MAYIDGFIAAVPEDRRDAYIAFARSMWPIFREYGALRMVENWGTDVPQGEVTSFPMAVRAEEGETVVFSWTVWPDRAARDEAWGRMMEDPRFAPGAIEMPFDGKRMVFGGFETVLDEGG